MTMYIDKQKILKELKGKLYLHPYSKVTDLPDYGRGKFEALQEIYNNIEAGKYDENEVVTTNKEIK